MCTRSVKCSRYTLEFSRQKGPLLSGSRFYWMVKKLLYSKSHFSQGGRIKACLNWKWWPCKHHQTLFYDQTCGCWSEGVVWYGCPNKQCIAHQTRKQKKCFTLLDQMFDGLQMLSNTTRHDQIKQHQTMFDGVWSPNISRLERPYRNKLKVSFIGVFLNTRINKTDCTNKKGPKCWYRRAKLLYRDATDYNSV